MSAVKSTVAVVPTPFYRVMFDSAPTPLIAMNCKGCVAAANAAARTLLGRDEDGIAGAPFAMMLAAGAAGADDAIGRALSGGPVRVAVIDRDAKKWPVDMTASRAAFGGDDCVVVALACAPAAAPSAPPPAPAGESFHGGFLAGVGHDMRTPLNVILGYGGMMQTAAAHTIDSGQVGELICDSARALLAHIDDLIELANLERGGVVEPAWTDPLEVLNAAVRGVRAEAKLRGVRVMGDLSGAPAAIWCDERACRRMVTTLLHDAVQRSRRDGEAQLSVVGMVGDGCRFTLRDDGTAPSAAAIAAALDPDAARDDFDRTPSTLTGRRLGLAVAHRLADLHGGRLTVEAGGARGVVVKVELPGPANDETKSRGR